MDIWDKEKRSAVMASIKSRDTRPELIVRSYLYHRGYRFRKNVKGMPGTPDIVLKKYGTVIFIHGCFWHGHTPDFHIPRSNSDYWKEKIERNRLRDKRDKERLRNAGWNVITVWECQLKPATREKTLFELEYLITRFYIKRLKDKAREKRYAEMEHRIPVAGKNQNALSE